MLVTRLYDRHGGSNHVRYVLPGITLRLTTDASITVVLQEEWFFLEDKLTLLLGPDEAAAWLHRLQR